MSVSPPFLALSSCANVLIYSNRYQQNYMSEPPSSFVNAPDEVLEEHCLTEHEQAWQMLRQAED